MALIPPFHDAAYLIVIADDEYIFSWERILTSTLEKYTSARMSCKNLTIVPYNAFHSIL